MKLRLWHLLAAAAGFMPSLHAATVSYAGFIEGIAVEDWLTATTDKGFADLDGDNVFGSSLGAIHWSTGGPRTGESSADVFGWTLGTVVGNQGQVASPGAPLIDLLGSPGQKSMAGIGAIGAAAGASGQFTFTLNGQFENYVGKTVRVSIMADVLEASLWSLDSNKTYQITGPGGADSGIISLRDGGAGNGVPEMYLFDISNIIPGDSFTVFAGTGSSLPAYVGPVAWDIAPTIPEPGTAIFGILGLGTLMSQRRRFRA